MRQIVFPLFLETFRTDDFREIIYLYETRFRLTYAQSYIQWKLFSISRNDHATTNSVTE